MGIQLLEVSVQVSRALLAFARDKSRMLDSVRLSAARQIAEKIATEAPLTERPDLTDPKGENPIVTYVMRYAVSVDASDIDARFADMEASRRLGLEQAAAILESEARNLVHDGSWVELRAAYLRQAERLRALARAT